MIGLTRRALLSLVALLGLTLAPTPAQAAEIPVPAGATTLTIAGQGHGHGHGMSQYGAAAAARQGLRYRQILRHYYPGTGWGRSGGRMKVLLTADTTPDVVVVNRKGLRAHVAGGRTWKLWKLARKAARTATRWRIVPLDATRSALDYRKRGWHRFAVVAGTLEFSAGGQPLTRVAGGRRTAYRGTWRAASPAPGSVARDTVNLVSLGAYLRGVVPREVPALWPTHAVRAQAVAARSYAAYERQYDSHGYFDVYDTTQDQVYGGRSAEHPAATRAIRATRGQVLTYAGAPAFTQFSASNGGWMLAGSRPYLVSGPDRFDPVRRWSTSVTLAWLRSVAPSAGTIQGIDLVTYPNAGPWVDEVLVRGSEKTVSIDGERFRSLAGLKSASFRLSVS